MIIIHTMRSRGEINKSKPISKCESCRQWEEGEERVKLERRALIPAMWLCECVNKAKKRDLLIF